LEKMISAIGTFFGEDPRRSPDFGRIVHKGRFRKLASYLDQGKIRFGGQADEAGLYIAPTLIDEVSMDSPIMQEEIFGPILPVHTYRSNEEALAIIQKHPWPLALYVFSSSRKAASEFVREVSFGGGCINNTLVHFGNAELPIGGIGYSGMGRYHGKESFRTFTHLKSVTRSATWLDPTIKYPPYKGKLKLFRRFFG
jgi:aldehyde dehydrogenase (NAD+)